MLVDEEEALVEIGRHEVDRNSEDSVPRRARRGVARDPVRADAEARADVADVLEVVAFGRVEADRAVLGDMAVGSEVAGEQSGQVGRRLVERWAILEEPGGRAPSCTTCLRGHPVVGAAQREPLEELRRPSRRRATLTKPLKPRAVAVGDAVGDAKGRDVPRRSRGSGETTVPGQWPGRSVAVVRSYRLSLFFTNHRCPSVA